VYAAKQTVEFVYRKGSASGKIAEPEGANGTELRAGAEDAT